MLFLKIDLSEKEKLALTQLVKHNTEKILKTSIFRIMLCLLMFLVVDVCFVYLSAIVVEFMNNGTFPSSLLIKLTKHFIPIFLLCLFYVYGRVFVDIIRQKSNFEDYSRRVILDKLKFFRSIWPIIYLIVYLLIYCLGFMVIAVISFSAFGVNFDFSFIFKLGFAYSFFVYIKEFFRAYKCKKKFMLLVAE